MGSAHSYQTVIIFRAAFPCLLQSNSCLSFLLRFLLQNTVCPRLEPGQRLKNRAFLREVIPEVTPAPKK